MHILLLEVALSGHHSNYLDHIASLFLSQGHRVTVSVRESQLADPLFERFRLQFPDQFKVAVLPAKSFVLDAAARLGVAGTELRHWLMFKLFFSRLNATDRVDQVFFPYLDYCLHACALLGPPSGRTPWGGICMRPSFHHRKAGVLAPYPKWGAIKEWLFLRMLKHKALKTVYTIDELLSQHVCQLHPTLAPQLQYIPDPAELQTRHNKSSARSLLNLAMDDFVVLVYGAIDARKGIDLLLKGVRGQRFPKNIRILVVGKQTPGLSAQLIGDPLVRTVNRYVDGDTEEAAFRAADVVWMGYRSHYSMSGVLVLAAIAGKPVLATQNGLIGWMSRHYALGPVLDCEDSQQVTQSIFALMTQSSATPPTSGMDTVTQRHSWDEFNRIILQTLHTDRSVLTC